MKKLDIQKIRIDLLEHENFYYPILYLAHKINSIIDHLEPVELPKEVKYCICDSKNPCLSHGEPKETSLYSPTKEEKKLVEKIKSDFEDWEKMKESPLRDGEIKQTLMRKVVYDELFDGSKVRRLVYTTLTIPKLHGYLESQMNNGSVNIINWEEMCLLTGTPN